LTHDLGAHSGTADGSASPKENNLRKNIRDWVCGRTLGAGHGCIDGLPANTDILARDGR
jgi:hypothetical protein